MNYFFSGKTFYLNKDEAIDLTANQFLGNAKQQKNNEAALCRIIENS